MDGASGFRVDEIVGFKPCAAVRDETLPDLPWFTDDLEMEPLSMGRPELKLPVSESGACTLGHVFAVAGRCHT